MKARPVVLIDNDSAWCEEVCRFLEPRGVAVVPVHGEAQALQALADIRTPAAILMEPSAVDQAFRLMLRDLPALENTPVFIVSAAPAHAVYEKGAGVTGYVRKTVALEHLPFLLSDDVAGPQAKPAQVVAA